MCKLHDRWSLKFFRGRLLNEHPGGFVFFWGRLPEILKLKNFLGGDRNYGMVVILLPSLCNYDNLTLKLHQGKRCYPDEGWLFIGKFKVGSVPGTSVALEASKKVTKSIMSIILFINKAA